MKPVIVAPLVALALAGAAAGGYFWLSSGGGVEEAVVAQPTASPTPTPTPAAQPSPSPAPADWQTYVDPGLGFSFLYRSDWTISTDYYELPAKKGNPAVTFRSVTFENPEGAQTIAFGVAPNPAGLTLEDWVASYPGWPSEPESVTVTGQPALLFPINQLGERFPAVYFKSGPYVISMSANIYGSGGEALPPGMSEVDFQRVLDSFNFPR